MTHDLFCPWPLCDYGQPDADCTGYEDCTHDCQCTLIAKVRADEREQSVRRILAATGRTCCPACVVEGQEHRCLLPDAIAAAEEGTVTLCANCGERLWRDSNARWLHCYTVSERCENGKRAMPKKEEPWTTTTRYAQRQSV